MSYKINGYNNCYICGKNISWEKLVVEPGVVGVYSIDGQEAELTITARNGKEVEYEAIVRCKSCGTRNKFTGKEEIK